MSFMFLVPSSPTNVNCDSGRRECVVAVEPHVGDLLILNFACEEDEEVDDDSNDHEDFNVVLVVPVGPVMGGDVCDFVCGIVFIVDEMTKLSPVILDSHLGFFFVINFPLKCFIIFLLIVFVHLGAFISFIIKVKLTYSRLHY